MTKSKIDIEFDGLHDALAYWGDPKLNKIINEWYVKLKKIEVLSDGKE